MITPRFATGLCLALAGPPLVAAVSVYAGRTPSILSNLVGQIALWLLAACVILLVRHWERHALSSIGLVRPTWRSLFWGAGTAAVLLYVATPIGVALVMWFDLPGFEGGISRLRTQPVPLLLFGAVTAGVVEELLYRGYAVERLSSATGSIWVGSLLSLAAFALGHLPFWGAGSALLTTIAGAVLTTLYVWKRDLTANMLAHGITAVVQLLQVAANR